MSTPNPTPHVHLDTDLICPRCAAADLPPGPRVIRMSEHTGWGDHVSWWTHDTGSGQGRIYGHMRHPKPKPGDLVASPMKSGKVGLYKIRKQGYDSKYDPPDMFFASVKFIGYEDESGVVL